LGFPALTGILRLSSG